MPALPRNCRRNETRMMPLASCLIEAGKAREVDIAASQETSLTGKIHPDRGERRN